MANGAKGSSQRRRSQRFEYLLPNALSFRLMVWLSYVLDEPRFDFALEAINDSSATRDAACKLALFAIRFCPVRL